MTKNRKLFRGLLDHNWTLFCKGEELLFEISFLREKCYLPFFPLVFCQVAYFTEMHKIFTELTDQIDQGGLTDEQRKQENEAKLNELRALSIVADDWDGKHPVTHVLLWCHVNNEVTSTFNLLLFCL